MGVVLYLVLAILAIAYLLIQKRYRFWIDRGFLCTNVKFPFGSFDGVGRKIAAFQALDKFYKEFKGKSPAAGFFIFLDPNILVMDPELIKNIFVRNFNSFHDRGFYHNKEDDPLSVHMFSLDGQEWKQRRSKVSPIFSSGKMKMMFEIVDSIADKLVNKLDEISSRGDLDIKIWVARFTTDVIGNVGFGLECECLDNEDSEFFKHGQRLSKFTAIEFLKLFITNGFPNLSRKLHLTTLPKKPAEFLLSSFLQTMEYREKNNLKRNDFVSLLLNLNNDLTPTELAGESFVFFFAGFETSSLLISFTCYCLGLNPDIQQRLRDEIQAGIDENDGKLSYEMLFGFKYLDMVVNESLRKYPPISISFRKCTQDYQIPDTNLIIPKGTSVQVPTYSLHRDPEHFPNPEKFDPERFNDENVKNRHPYAFLPFAEGPRNCIGMRFGLMQSKIAIARIVSNFEILPTEKTPSKIKFLPSGLFTVPEGGMWLKIEKID